MEYVPSKNFMFSLAVVFGYDDTYGQLQTQNVQQTNSHLGLVDMKENTQHVIHDTLRSNINHLVLLPLPIKLLLEVHIHYVCSNFPKVHFRFIIIE